MNALPGDVLSWIYGAALLVGFLYALFLLFFQGVGHAFDLDVHHGLGFDHDLDLSLGHSGVHDSGEAGGLSMLAVSGFVTAFGAFGLLSRLVLGAMALVSLITAVAAGVVVGGLAQAFFVKVLSPTVSHNLSLSDLKGKAAQVTVPIPAMGLGQVAAVLGGQRVTLSARSSAQVEIKRGTQVVIDSVADGVAYVSPPQA